MIKSWKLWGIKLMKVEELIRKLLTHPKDMEVHLYGFEGVTYPVRAVYREKAVIKQGKKKKTTENEVVKLT